jgi:hypothetical protein
MPRILVDLIESKDTGMPVRSINSKGIRHFQYQHWQSRLHKR